MLGFPVAFARWDPVRDLLAIHQRLDPFAAGPGGWVPPVDVRETADRYVITAEVPGLVRSDLEISLRDGDLTIAGVRRERATTCEQFHRIERGHGSFTRTFHLPLPVDGEAIEADLKDGLLTISCPKASTATARRIQVL